MPNMFIGSLATMQPRDSFSLHTVYLEQLKEWLSNTEGPDLIEGTEATKPDRLPGMAVSFDPVRYYPPTGLNAVVGMGLVFKPAYIPMVSFSSLLTTLMDWSVNLKERMSEACLTFLNVSPESEVYPLCKDYPVLLDLISQELVSSHFMRSRVTNFRAFFLLDHSQRDPSLDKMPKQEASTQEVTKPTRGILCPSKLPRRDLKYSKERHTLLDSQGRLIGCV